jgi:hypothetical protein
MIHALFIVTMQLAAGPELANLYRSARAYDKASFRFAPPSAEACQRVRTLVAHLTKSLHAGAPPPVLIAEAKTAGLVLEPARDAAGELWVLHEPDGQRAGGGFYVFRAGGSPLAIEAPHTFFDEGTGDIALALFARLKAGAMFCNTVHRYAPAVGGGEHPADVAHASQTLFAAANQGLLDSVRWAVVQVHGFGDKQGLPADVKAVVSDGVAARAADAPAVRLRAALASRWGAGNVRLYGVDADVLGATTNVEGKVARQVGAVFLHVEMSASTRRMLVGDASTLASALSEILRLR